MSDLNSRERRKLEQLLNMGGGYVLLFNNREFAQFFSEFVHKDIDDPKYAVNGESKARRLRVFWDIEPNHVVARSLNEMIAHAKDEDWPLDPQALADCAPIFSRLSQDQPVADIDAITGDKDDRNFELVAQAVREAIEKHQPELGLDRLHTWVVKFVRQLCESHGIAHDRSTPLNGLFGAYVKHLERAGHLSSDMTKRILKSSIANLEAFNLVRNNHSLAHDNEVLPYDEALLICNHVVSTMRFVKAFEDKVRQVEVSVEQIDDDVF